MGKKVFEGINVADFSWAGVGPLSAKYFAEHGATVVKIESHKRLDILRTTTPFVNKTPAPDTSMFFAKMNGGKMSVTLDLHHPNGQKLAHKFIAWADIMVENFSPGTMKRFGIDYEVARKINPGIIYLSSSMQGETGPHAQYSGFGMNAVNLCGFSEITGWPDRRAAAPSGAYTDFICPRFNALGILAALDYRRRTGKGQRVEQSQFESSNHFLASPLMDYQINGRIMHRNGNRYHGASPHGAFQCQGEDTWVAIAVLNEEQWKNFCKAIGTPSLSTQKEYATLAERKKNEDALEKLVTAWTVKRTAEEAEAVMQKAGVPASKVEKPVDIFNDPQVKHRGYFVPMKHAAMGLQQFEVQSCFLLSKTPREMVRPSPCLGEHNEYVFKELLKMTDDEIAEHIIDGSITTELVSPMKSSM